MSISRALGILTAAVVIDGLTTSGTRPVSDKPRPRAASGSSADTFPTFERVVRLEETSETSANVSEAPSAVYFNDGTGRTFHTIHIGDNAGTVYGFAIADLDRDGAVDIAAARSDAPNVVYFGRLATKR